MGGLHVVITIYSGVETCVMGEEREREVEGGGRKEGINFTCSDNLSLVVWKHV